MARGAGLALVIGWSACSGGSDRDPPPAPAPAPVRVAPADASAPAIDASSAVALRLDGAPVDAATPDAAPDAPPPTGRIRVSATSKSYGGIKPPAGEQRPPPERGIRCNVTITDAAGVATVVRTNDAGESTVRVPPGRYTIAFSRECMPSGCKPSMPPRRTVQVVAGKTSGSSESCAYVSQ